MYEKNRIVDDGLRFYGRLHGYPRYRRWEKSLHQQLFVGRVVYQRISVPLRQINNSVAKKSALVQRRGAFLVIYV